MQASRRGDGGAFLATATMAAILPGHSRSQGPGRTGPVGAAGLDSASLLVRQSAQAVEVTDLRGEAEDTWANPDGTFTLRS